MEQIDLKKFITEQRERIEGHQIKAVCDAVAKLDPISKKQTIRLDFPLDESIEERLQANGLKLSRVSAPSSPPGCRYRVSFV